MASWILEPIRNIYVSLHQDTDSAPAWFSASTPNWDVILQEPSSYPVCEVAGHIHDDSAIQHDNAALVPSIPSLAASPLSLSSSLRLIESLADAQPLDNFHPTHQPSINSLGVPVSSPASASGIATLHPTPETSISSPLFPTSPPAVIALRQHAGPPTPSDPPTFPPLASSGRVLDHMIPIVAAPPGASPGLTSAPDLGAAAEDDGIRKPGLRKDNNAVDTPSVNRVNHGNTMSTLYPPQQSPSLPSVTDSDLVVTGRRSSRGPIPERTGDHPPRPLQPDHRYDIL